MAVERLKLNVSRIIPGDRGKAGSGWLTRLLINRPKGWRRRQNSQVPLARSHVSKANEGSAARDDKKPFRAGSSSPGRFRAWANRSCRDRQTVATAYQHGAGDSGGIQK